MKDSFGARSTLAIGEDSFEIYRLDAVTEGHAAQLPYSLKILLENLLRHEDGITVRNAFLGITFPRTGHGGMPTAVHYPVSGHTETAFEWRDRLYHPDRERFMLVDDDDATARVVSKGPLQVVVETSGQFVRAGEAPGNNRATYRWTFRAHSPVVGFHALVEREDDFAWPELHILQISRKDDRLSAWAGEDAHVQSGPLLDNEDQRAFGPGSFPGCRGRSLGARLCPEVRGRKNLHRENRLIRGTIWNLKRQGG